MSFFRILAEPGKKTSTSLSLLLFIICIFLYGYTSHNRHQENELDKIVPTPTAMWQSFKAAIFEPIIEEEYTEDGDLIPNNNPKTLSEAYKQGTHWEMLKNGKWQLFEDSWASLQRVLISMLFICFGVLIGVYMGMLPYVEKLLYKFVLFFDKVPALAILPMLFIIFGLGETAKIALIVMGVAPTIILDTYLRVKDVPKEQIIKGFTLKASEPENIYKIVLPQIMPKVIDTIRLNFKAIILFLIAGEALAAEAGLGYRIFVVRRYMDMATIIPYVMWISGWAFAADALVRYWLSQKFKWVGK